MDLDLDTDLDPEFGGLRLRTLGIADAPLVVEATGAETGRSLWGARPAGPYDLTAAQTALTDWDLARGGQVSYGVVGGGRLLAALGVMPDGDPPGSPGPPASAELAYWVRPESRRRGIALQAVRALTRWAHGEAGLGRIWLEIDPANLPSQRLARKVGYRFETRLPQHCRSWIHDDPAADTRHDCLIWAHTGRG
jgi:RimJ/RimL family protein N-acetyltransferase